MITEEVGGGGNVTDHNTGTCPLGELRLSKIKPLLATDMTVEENLPRLFEGNRICWVITVGIKNEEFTTQTMFKTRISQVFISYCLLLWCRWGYSGPFDLFPTRRLTCLAQQRTNSTWLVYQLRNLLFRSAGKLIKHFRVD